MSYGTSCSGGSTQRSWRPAQYQLSVIKLVKHAHVVKMQSDSRVDGKVLLVHVKAEVMSLKVRFETRKRVTLSQLVW